MGLMKVLSLLVTLPLGCVAFVSPAAFACPRVPVLYGSNDEYDLGKEVASLVGKAAKSMAGDAASAATDGVKTLTGKDEYEFGDLSKFLVAKADEQARKAANAWTDEENATFSDLTRVLDEKLKCAVDEAKSSEEWSMVKDMGDLVGPEAKEKLASLIGKDDFEVGDITEVVSKELIDMVQSTSFSLDDGFFLLRVLTSFGLGMNPVVLATFPLNILVQMYNFSLVQEAGSRVTGAVALELDRRAKTVLMDEPKNKMFGEGAADASNAELFKKAVLEHIGKEDYNFGDIAKNLVSVLESPTVEVEPIGASGPEDLNPELKVALTEIDEAVKELEAVEAES